MTPRFNHISASVQALGIAACLAVIALAARFNTTPELTLDLIYLVPVGFAAWFIGVRIGIVISVIAGIAWSIAYHYSGYRAAHPHQFWWNATMLECFFILVAILFAKLSQATKRLLQSKLDLESANENLRLANDKLRNLDRQKDEFLAICSHDIRSPLCGILAGGELLAREVKGTLNAQQREVVERSMNSARGIIALTNDLLDLARIEAGQEALNNECFDLRTLLHESAELQKQTLGAKCRFEIRASAGEIEVVADRLKLQRIFNNLLSNATKYSPVGGTVLIDVQCERQNVIVSIKDSGPGIPAEQVSKIFDRFSSLAALKKSREEGTGLGLSITRELVMLHQGTIAVSSKPGEGATFTVRLPIRSLNQKFVVESWPRNNEAVNSVNTRNVMAT